VVGNGAEPVDTVTAEDEAELLAAAELAADVLAPAPAVVAAAVDPVPLDLAHPVRASPAAMATTANAPAGRRTSCA
jgi:hypothetical protein